MINSHHMTDQEIKIFITRFLASETARALPEPVRIQILSQVKNGDSELLSKISALIDLEPKQEVLMNQYADNLSAQVAREVLKERIKKQKYLNK